VTGIQVPRTGIRVPLGGHQHPSQCRAKARDRIALTERRGTTSIQVVNCYPTSAMTRSWKSVLIITDISSIYIYRDAVCIVMAAHVVIRRFDCRMSPSSQRPLLLLVFFFSRFLAPLQTLTLANVGFILPHLRRCWQLSDRSGAVLPICNQHQTSSNAQRLIRLSRLLVAILATQKVTKKTMEYVPISEGNPLKTVCAPKIQESDPHSSV